jgi:O-antigen ligase
LTQVGSMKSIFRKDMPSFALVWVAFSFVLSTSYLLPTHQEPWTSFYPQLLAALAFAALGFFLALRYRRFEIDCSIILLLAVASLPLVQAALGQFLVPGEAGLVFLYLLGLPAAYLLARESTRKDAWKFADALFTSLCFAGLISSAMAIIQWQGLNIGGAMVAPPIVGGRSIANVGQPNMLATLLVWSFIATWWLSERRLIAGWLFFLAGGMLVLGLATTQSRTGALQMAGVAMAALWVGFRFRSWKNLAYVLILVAAFFALLLSWPELNQQTHGQAALSLQQMAETGKRPQIWAMMWAAVREAPWTGYGWNQGLQAYLCQLPNFPAMHIVLADSHNLILDLMVWAGLPLGLLLGTLLLAFTGYLAWQIEQAEAILLATFVGVFLCHTMTELPHAYSHFLLPVASVYGCLAAATTRSIFSVSRAWLVTVCFAALAVLLVIGEDYLAIEDDVLAARVRAARIGDLTPVTPPRSLLLSFLQDSLSILRQQASEIDNDVKYRDLIKTSQRYPSVNGLIVRAQVEAAQGNSKQRDLTLNQICALYSGEVCALAHKKVSADSDANLAPAGQRGAGSEN